MVNFRINIFGFPSRQHFEEFFMSLLVLINKENDVNIVGSFIIYIFYFENKMKAVV